MSPSDCLVSYQEHSLGGWVSKLYAEMELVDSISTTPYTSTVNNVGYRKVSCLTERGIEGC